MGSLRRGRRTFRTQITRTVIAGTPASTSGHTIVDMESWQRPIAEQLAELDSLDLTPDERALAEGYILEGPEAVEWAEAALAVMTPIDDGGYQF